MRPHEERALLIECEGARMAAVLHAPREPFARGVLIVVGGPQYRAGSHRQFVLLARDLAASGIAALRFDYRGMGDSEGEARTFEDVDADVRSAVDAFFSAVPELRELVVWGLCDAASATVFYAPRDARVTGVVLLNPWVRTAEGIARAHLKHYYLARLADPELWRKLLRGEFSVRTAAAGLFSSLGRVMRGSGRPEGQSEAGAAASSRPLPERMLEALTRFRGQVLVILSGNDLTAGEFRDTVQRSAGWRAALANARVARRDLAEADHTFSTREWRNRVARWTREWVQSW